MFFNRDTNKESKNNMNKKLEKLESDLQKTKEELKNLIDSKFLEIKYPNGVIEQTWFSFSIFTLSNNFSRDNVVFKYSDGFKVVKIPLTYFKDVLTEYKILIHENTVYVGVKSEYEEEYFVIDKNTSTVVQINNDSVSEIKESTWIKS